MSCAVEGCGRPVRSVGLCEAHYSRLRRRGDVLAHIPVGQKTTPEDCPMCEDAQDMRDYGIGDAWEMSRRTGVRPRSLDKHFRRHGRHDLVEWARPAIREDHRIYAASRRQP